MRPARHSSNRLGSKRILFPSTHAQWLDATEETTKTSTQLCSSSYRRSGTCVIFALVPSHHAGKVRTLACTIAQARGKIATTAPKSNITILGGSGNWTGQIKTLTIELILKYNTFIYISYFNRDYTQQNRILREYIDLDHHRTGSSLLYGAMREDYG